MHTKKGEHLLTRIFQDDVFSCRILAANGWTWARLAMEKASRKRKKFSTNSSLYQNLSSGLQLSVNFSVRHCVSTFQFDPKDTAVLTANNDWVLASIDRAASKKRAADLRI